MQSIGQAFGGVVVHAKCIMHGKVSAIEHDGQGLFAGIKSPVKANPLSFAGAGAFNAAGMSAGDGRKRTMEKLWEFGTKTLDVEGVQFHPESVLTPAGKADAEEFCEKV